MREKLPAGPSEGAVAGVTDGRTALSALEQDVLSALLNLGCTAAAAEAAVKKAKTAALPMNSSRFSAVRLSS